MECWNIGQVDRKTQDNRFAILTGSVAFTTGSVPEVLICITSQNAYFLLAGDIK